MREIKFRAKSLDGIWFTWKLLDPIDMAFLAIDPKTLGEYTGFQDHNEKEICEGDILNVRGDSDGEGTDDYNEDKEVIWSGSALQWQWGEDGGNSCPLHELDNDFFMIIGNIHDNPELLDK